MHRRDYRGGVARTSSVTITGAQAPLSADQRARTRRYLISMAIRTVCFIGAIIATGWLRWALVAGAVLLPYVAVIMANAYGPRLMTHGNEWRGYAAAKRSGSSVAVNMGRASARRKR